MSNSRSGSSFYLSTLYNPAVTLILFLRLGGHNVNTRAENCPVPLLICYSNVKVIICFFLNCFIALVFVQIRSGLASKLANNKLISCHVVFVYWGNLKKIVCVRNYPRALLADLGNGNPFTKWNDCLYALRLPPNFGRLPEFAYVTSLTNKFGYYIIVFCSENPDTIRTSLPLSGRELWSKSLSETVDSRNDGLNSNVLSFCGLCYLHSKY